MDGVGVTMLAALTAFLVAVIVYANVNLRNETKGMTPKQRKAFDNETDEEAAIW